MLCKLLVVLVFAMLPVLSMAQENFGPEAGKWELTLAGSGASDEDWVDNAFALNVNLGYYLTKEFELSVRQSLGIVDQSGSDDDYSASTSLAIDYHFDLGRWQPFIGAKIGYLYGDVVEDTWMAGPEAGVKFFVNQTTFIFGMAEYEFLFDDGDDVNDAFDDGRWVYSVGIGFLF